MKTIKLDIRFIGLFLAAFAMVASSSSLSAQSQKEEKKVVIIKKIKDDNGNVTTEKQVLTGEDADVFIKGGNNINIDLREGAVKMLMKGIEHTVIETDGENTNINVNVEMGDAPSKFNLDEYDTKNAEVIEWWGKGPFPENIQKELKALNIDPATLHKGGSEHTKKRIKRFDHHNEANDKGYLGVVIEDHDKGVLIEKVIVKSAGAAAGLKDGDIITAVNGKKVTTANELVDAIKKLKAGDKTNIDYIRGEATQKAVATLQARPERMARVWQSEDGESIDLNNMDFQFNDVDINIDLEDLGKLGEKGDVKIFKFDTKTMTEADIKQLEDIGINIEELKNHAEGEFEILDPNSIKIDINGDLSEESIKSLKEQGWDTDHNAPNTNKAFLGVIMNNPTEKGLPILNVVEGSAANKAGFQKGDIINTVDGKEIKDFNSLIGSLSRFNANDVVKINYTRGSETKDIEVKLGKHEAMKQKMIFIEDEENEDGENTIIRKRIKVDCNTKAACKKDNKAYLGVYLNTEKEGLKGVYVSGTMKDSNAKKAGLKEGDIIIKVGKKVTPTYEALKAAMATHKPKDEVKVKYIRDGKKKKATITLNSKSEVCPPSACNKGNASSCNKGNKRFQHFNLDNHVDMQRHVVIIKKGNAANTTAPSVETPAVEAVVPTSNTLNLSDINLFPNPSNGTFNVKFTADSKVPTRVTVVNISGKEVFSDTVKDFDGSYERSIDIMKESKGVYFLNIIQGNQVYTEKLIYQ